MCEKRKTARVAICLLDQDNTILSHRDIVCDWNEKIEPIIYTAEQISMKHFLAGHIAIELVKQISLTSIYDLITEGEEKQKGKNEN